MICARVCAHARSVSDTIAVTHFTLRQSTFQNFLLGIDTDKSSDYIEQCICRKEALFKVGTQFAVIRCTTHLLIKLMHLGQVLRLVCLQSVANGGLKPKIFDFYRFVLYATAHCTGFNV